MGTSAASTAKAGNGIPPQISPPRIKSEAIQSHAQPGQASHIKPPGRGKYGQPPASARNPDLIQDGQEPCKTSVLATALSEKVCVPYWNAQCAERSARLWLPTAADWLPSDPNSLPSWSLEPVAASWFSTKFLSAPKPGLDKLFTPSFTSILAAATGLAATRARRIRLYPTADQKRLFKRWFGVSRLVFNKTVEVLAVPGTKANWKEIKGPILADLPEFCAEVPHQIKSLAIKDACDAVQAAKRK